LGEESRTEASGRAIELEAKQEFAWNKISNKKKIRTILFSQA